MERVELYPCAQLSEIHFSCAEGFLLHAPSSRARLCLHGDPLTVDFLFELPPIDGVATT